MQILSARMPTFEPEVLPSLRDVWSPQGSWTPGTGYTDLERSCSALKDIGYDGWLTIESFAQREPELAAAAAIWRDLVASGDELACSGLRFIKHISRETGMLPT
jgi:sugar phosphate isomerase/epimerase